MRGVYVLLLCNGCYYVGQSADVDKRIAEHRGLGPRCAAFVKHGGGVSRVLPPVTPRCEDLALWEQKEVLTLMQHHGFNRVRGFEFCEVRLRSGDGDMIRRLMFGGTPNLCRKCGREGHFAQACNAQTKSEWMADLENAISTEPEGAPPKTAVRNKRAAPARKVLACGRCGRKGHVIEQCYAKVDVNGDALSSEEDEEEEEEEEEVCFRCGRVGHYAADCFAKRHASGYFLRR
jgi:hypothetical protein